MAMQVPHGPDHMRCPLWHKAMSKVCHTCPWWTQIRGKSPQTGEEIDRWDCAIAHMPILQIEVANMVRGTRAATESMRNEIVVRMDNPNPLPAPQDDTKRLRGPDDVRR